MPTNRHTGWKKDQGRRWSRRRGRSEPRRCLDCQKNIDDRGPTTKRCLDCAQVHSIRWRRRYDSRPEAVAKRRAYGANKRNIAKARTRRNAKTYLLALALRLLDLEGRTIDSALRGAIKRARSEGVSLAIGRMGPQPLPEGRWAYPWTTLRGQFERKKSRT